MGIHVVVGGQYGSEAKGHVTQRVCQREVDQGRYILNVRVAGPNAGHSVVDPDGRKWAMRQVPVGFALHGVSARAQTTLAIAAGSEVDPLVLLKEVDQLTEAGLLKTHQLWVDPEVTLIEDEHKEREMGLVARIGSTGKGIGAARADRTLRRARRLVDDQPLMGELYARGVIVAPVEEIIIDHASESCATIVEGTQGYGLGMHAGMYPKVTSSDCRAIDFLAMAGISPWGALPQDVAVWVVLRPYPIRVAGDSGPLRYETTWEQLGLQPELTTVTQKVRRVGLWDFEIAQRAIVANGGGDLHDQTSSVRLAFSMLDQVYPTLAGANTLGDLAEHETAIKWIRDRELELQARVDLVTTSDRTGVWLR